MSVDTPARTAPARHPEHDSCEPLAVLGRDVRVPLAGGDDIPYAALDQAASAPVLSRVWDELAAYAPYYGSVHRGAGQLSRLSTDRYERSRAD
ncbi:cysteine desulfurase, partial [Streptomyces oceani]